MNIKPHIDLKILYQDEHYVAVHKPAGLLLHRSLIDKRETRFLMTLVRDALGQHVYPVHRLDRPTHGVVIMALDPHSARELNIRFAEGKIRKTYWAICRGYLSGSGTIDYALKEELDKMTDARARKNKEPQDAVTHYRCLRMMEIEEAVGRYRSARFSLLELHPKTGRKHQLRRHLKHIFHPIIGDTTHGDGAQNRFFREFFHSQRLMLCALAMDFVHPYTNDVVHIKTVPEGSMASVLRHEAWRKPD